MMTPPGSAVRAFLAVSLLAGCASVPPKAGFDDVRESVSGRVASTVEWIQGSEEEAAVEARVRAILERPLTADGAVQIALLSNRRLQAAYEDLGVAHAELVQAGLLPNPLFDAEVKITEGADEAVLEMGIVQPFLDALLIPLRKRAAEAGFEAAKLRVTAAVMDLAREVHLACHQLQADGRKLEMFRSVLLAAESAYEMAQRMREAGNITQLEVLNERALYEQVKLDVAAAEGLVAEDRERLNSLMGLWGPWTDWLMNEGLAPIPESQPDLDGLERRAIQRSLDLMMARRDLEQIARRLGIARATALLDEFHVGVASEREPGNEWSVGPAFGFPLPLFDQGQARTAGARAEFRQSWDRYTALAVEIRSAARAARYRLLLSRQRAAYYQHVILPLRRTITDQSQLRYNGMLLSVFDLLQAKQQEIAAETRYIDELLNYWSASIDLQQILNGRLVRTGETRNTMARADAAPPGGGNGGH